MDTTTTTTPLALNVEAAARMAGISRATLYNLWSEDKGPRFFMVGKRRLVRVEALRDWVRQQENAA